MKINIASARSVAENIDFIKRNNVNVISIRDSSPNQENAHYYDIIDKAGLQNLLVVNFDDITSPLPPERGEKMPNKEDISNILQWAQQRIKENNNDFIVHCTGGVSRSSAVAILVQYLQDPTNALKVINPILHSPNEKVLEIGEDVLHTKDIKEPTHKLIKEYDDQFKEQVGKK